MTRRARLLLVLAVAFALAGVGSGAPDSFDLDEQTNYFVQVRKVTGVPNCPSNLITLCGRVGVSPGPGASGPWLGVPRPNPTGGLVALTWCLPEAARTAIEVMDIAGRVVARPVDQDHAAGVHVALWDARAAAPGIYLVRARARGWSAARRVLVLH